MAPFVIYTVPRPRDPDPGGDRPRLPERERQAHARQHAHGHPRHVPRRIREQHHPRGHRVDRARDPRPDPRLRDRDVSQQPCFDDSSRPLQVCSPTSAASTSPSCSSRRSDRPGSSPAWLNAVEAEPVESRLQPLLVLRRGDRLPVLPDPAHGARHHPGARRSPSVVARGRGKSRRLELQLLAHRRHSCAAALGARRRCCCSSAARSPPMPRPTP